MDDLKFLLSTTTGLIITGLIFSAIISVFIAYFTKQSKLAAFTMGIVLGPIAWIIIYFNNDRGVLNNERELLATIHENESIRFSQENADRIIKHLQNSLKTLEFGRKIHIILFPCLLFFLIVLFFKKISIFELLLVIIFILDVITINLVYHSYIRLKCYTDKNFNEVKFVSIDDWLWELGFYFKTGSDEQLIDDTLSLIDKILKRVYSRSF